MLELETHRRILIVDDNRAIHDDLRKLLTATPDSELTRFEGALFGDAEPRSESFELDSAYQGEEGAALVRQASSEGRPYSLAIVDMRMPPGWDGLRTIETMWECDPELQVVICTAYSDSSWTDIRQRFGATDRLLILKKPFDLEEVCQLACAMTDKWRLARQAKRHVSELNRIVEEQTSELKRLYRDLQCSSEKALARAEDELSRSLALSREVQESVLDGIVVIDPSGMVATANRRFNEMWNIPPDMTASLDEQQLLRHLVSLTVDPGAFLDRVAHLASDRDSMGSDEVRLKDERVFERWTAPVQATSGVYLGRLWCFRDVTERHKLAADRAVLTERMASMGRIAASVGHEINNPLTYVFGNVDWLADTCAASLSARSGSVPLGEFVKALESTREGLSRIRDIVSNLESLTRADDESRSDVDIVHVLDQSIQFAANEVRHRAHIVRRYEGVPLAIGVSSQIGQVFLNLIVNAAHAIPEGRAAENSITIGCRTTDDSVIVEISDTGAGVAAEHMDRLFDPFFTTKPIGAGAGLGLSICRGIVEAHKGTISVSSRLGSGSTFTVTLPKGGVEDATTRSHDVARPAESRRRVRVLIIDDEACISEMLVRQLEGRYQVLSTIDAREALERIRAGEQFDVILCDLMMADMSGMSFHAELTRSHPELGKRLVFMTGGAFTPQAKTLLDSLDNDVLKKPFSPDEVTMVIEQHADEPLGDRA